MKILNISIKDKIATYQKTDGDIVCANSDYQIKFAFDSEWDAHAEKIARFKWNGSYIDVPFAGDTCAVPEIDNAALCWVGVYAGELRTTTPAVIKCKGSILCGNATPSVENDKFWANEAKEAADRAEAVAGQIPRVGENGNWWIGDTDTGVSASGDGLVEETDPTVPDWAKQPTKPTYTAEEVGALPADTEIPEQVQPDWNQNDPEAADYVKNRTHWKEEKLTSCGTITGSRESETVFRADATDENRAVYRAVGYEDGEMVLRINGINYPVTFKQNGEGHIISGDGYAESEYEYDARFNFLRYDGSTILTFTNGNTFPEGEIGIEVFRDESVWHRLDKHYLPEDTVTEDMVSELIPDYLPNPKTLGFFYPTSDDGSGRVFGQYDGRYDVRIDFPCPLDELASEDFVTEKIGEIEIPEPYTLPTATADTLGGIKADPAQETDTQPVRIGADGKLVTAASSGGGGKTLTKIIDVTTTEQATVWLSTDSNGDPLAEEEIFIVAEIAAQSGNRDTYAMINGVVLGNYGFKSKDTLTIHTHFITITDEFIYSQYKNWGAAFSSVGQTPVALFVKNTSGSNKIESISTGYQPPPSGSRFVVYAWR